MTVDPGYNNRSEGVSRSVNRVPRTTLDLDDAVLRELKRRQQVEHKPLGELVSELLARALSEEPTNETPLPLEWTRQPIGPQGRSRRQGSGLKILDTS